MEKKNGNDFQRTLDKLIQSLQDFGDRVNDLFEPIRESIREFWETFSEKWPWIFSNFVLEAIEQGDYEFIDNFVRNGLWIKPSLHESKTRYNSLSLERKGAVEGHSGHPIHDIYLDKFVVVRHTPPLFSVK